MANLKKLLLIGDSITEMAVDPSIFGWSAFLQTQYMRRLDLVNKGLSGYTTRWYKVLIEPTMLAISTEKDYVELTILMLGSNDCVDPKVEPKSNQAVPVDEYSRNLESIVKSIKKRSTRIILATAPPTDEKLWPSRPFERVNEYRRAGLKLGKNLSIPVLDTWPLFLGEECKHDQKALDHFLSDGLHFTSAGNRIFGRKLFEFIVETWPELQPESLKMIPRHWSTVENDKLPDCLFE